MGQHGGNRDRNVRAPADKDRIDARIGKNIVTLVDYGHICALERRA